MGGKGEAQDEAMHLRVKINLIHRAGSKLHEQKLKTPLSSPYYSTSNRIQSDNLSKH